MHLYRQYLYYGKPDGSSAQKVLDSYPGSFFADNGWVYYSNYTSISIINTDGTDNTFIVSGTTEAEIFTKEIEQENPLNDSSHEIHSK